MPSLLRQFPLSATFANSDQSVDDVTNNTTEVFANRDDSSTPGCVSANKVSGLGNQPDFSTALNLSSRIFGTSSSSDGDVWNFYLRQTDQFGNVGDCSDETVEFTYDSLSSTIALDKTTTGYHLIMMEIQHSILKHQPLHSQTQKLEAR